MILIISEKDQIIGADKEFLNGESFESLKENFPSMSLFLLQSANANFEFEYNNTPYYVKKQSIITNDGNGYLYIFTQNADANDIVNNENKMNLSNEAISQQKEETSQENELEINLNFDNEKIAEEKEDNLDLGLDDESKEDKKDNLDLGLDDEPKEDKKVELDLGLDDEPKDDKEVELDLGLDGESKEDKEENLDLGLDGESKEDKEENLDLGLDNKPKEDKKVELDLGLDDEPKEDKEVELDLGLDNKPKEDKEVELDLGLDGESKEDKITTTNNIETITISKEEIDHDLQQACKDLGIDSQTIEEFYKDFQQQVIEEKPNFEESINNDNYELLHKTAHKLKGVALNLRLNKFGELLKTIDEASKQKKDMLVIKNMLNNLYELIDNNQTIDISIPNTDEEDTQIILKSFIPFLEDLKTKDNNTIKKQLQYAYSLYKIKALENLDKEDLKKFIELLLENIKGNIK